MYGIDKLVIGKEQYNCLLMALDKDVQEGVFGGGFITVDKKYNEARAVNIYPVPDFLENGYSLLNLLAVYSDSWFNKMKDDLKGKGEKIGFEYYTVPFQLDEAKINECRSRHVNFGIGIKVSLFVVNSHLRNALGEAFLFYDSNNNVIIDAYVPESNEKDSVNTIHDRYARARKNRALEVVVE